jgi:hypothetical protein
VVEGIWVFSMGEAGVWDRCHATRKMGMQIFLPKLHIQNATFSPHVPKLMLVRKKYLASGLEK